VVSVKKKLSIFLFILFFALPISSLAWSGSDIITIKPVENWADIIGVNMQLNDSSYYSNSILEQHLSIMMNTINTDMTTYNASYYIIQSMQYTSSTKSVEYKITYFNSLSGFNSITSDVYPYSTYVQWRAQVSSGCVGNRVMRFDSSTNILSTNYSSSITWNMGNSYNIQPGTLSSEPNVVYIPKRFYIDSNIPESSFDLLQFTTDSYSGYAQIKFDGYDTISRNTTFLLSNYIDFSLIVDTEPPIVLHRKRCQGEAVTLFVICCSYVPDHIPSLRVERQHVSIKSRHKDLVA
jgi:hypothetical protein